MAYTRASSPLFLIPLLLFSIANPRSHATIVSPYDYVSATGQLCCTNNGNCPGTPVAGAVVTLTCSNSLFTTVVGQNTTTINGFFIITAAAPAGSGSSLGVPAKCILNVQLPLNAAICPVLSTTSGSLTGLLLPAGTTVIQGLGRVLSLQLQLFFKTPSV